MTTYPKLRGMKRAVTIRMWLWVRAFEHEQGTERFEVIVDLGERAFVCGQPYDQVEDAVQLANSIAETLRPIEAP